MINWGERSEPKLRSTLGLSYYAAINVRPHPPVGHRVGLTESIDIKLRPRGGDFVVHVTAYAERKVLFCMFLCTNMLCSSCVS